MIRNAFFTFLLATTPAFAQDLTVPRGVETRSESSPAQSIRLPTEPWSSDTPAPTVEGAIHRRVLRITDGAQTTLQILIPLRTALIDAGFSEIFSCESITCGGFDFRFQLDLLGEPEMHVDLGDFRYLLVENTDGRASIARQISLVISRDTQAGYVHITEVFPPVLAPSEAQPTTSAQSARAASEPGSLPAALESMGHSVLPDLVFGSGASDLGDGTFQSLADLAVWLNANPTAQIAIVGHTDAVGGLAENTALSRRRAESVRTRLADAYGANPAQMQADGAGYLAPVASNLAEEGRALNRRVEVVLLSK